MAIHGRELNPDRDTSWDMDNRGRRGDWLCIVWAHQGLIGQRCADCGLIAARAA